MDKDSRMAIQASRLCDSRIDMRRRPPSGRRGQSHLQDRTLGEPGCRIGIVRRQIDKRPFLRKSKNPGERAARHAGIGTDAVDFPCQEQTLVIARVACQ
jgi:hypothetical protein